MSRSLPRLGRRSSGSQLKQTTRSHNLTVMQPTMQARNSLLVGNYEVTVDKFLHYGSKIGCCYVESYSATARITNEPDDIQVEQWPCTLRKIPFASTDLKKMCEDEVQIFLALKDGGHPSTVQLLGHAFAEHSSVTKTPLWDVFYLFSETERGNLWSFVQEQRIAGRWLDEEKIIRVAINVVDAVALLHSSSPPLIHRNISPGNIVETTSGAFKLSSFISAAFAPPRRLRTSELLPLREDLACFTETMYRSPEMMDLDTETGVTTQSDIWSIGVLLYAMCYGRHPFEGKDTEQIRQGEVPRPHYNAYSVVESFIDLILKKDPSARPTASALQFSLRSALGPRAPLLSSIPRLMFHPGLRDSLTMPRDSYLLRDLNGKNPSLLWYPEDVRPWVKAPIVPSRNLKPDGTLELDGSQANIYKQSGSPGERSGIAVLHRRTQSLRDNRSDRSNLSETEPVQTVAPTASLNLKNNTSHPAHQDIRPSMDQSAQDPSSSKKRGGSLSSFISNQATAGLNSTASSGRSSVSLPATFARPGSSLGLVRGLGVGHAHDPDTMDQRIRGSAEDRPPEFVSRDAESGSPSPLIDDIGSSVKSVSPVAVRINGRFCDVFEGIHVTEGKVALKRPRIGGTGYDEGVIRSFEREAATWRYLRHPRILPFIGTFKRDGHLYFVSPFMEKGTLVEFIKERPWVNRIRLLHETADAIRYLHNKKVVHGDIKGNNILIGNHEHALLCDFGLTKVAPSQTSTSLKGAGTVRWQSPELWEDSPKTFKSDVYAFGMTIVEALKGKVPFAHHTNDMAVMLAVISKGERPSKDPMSSPTGISYSRAWNVAEACWAGQAEARISILEAFRSLGADPSLRRPN